MAKRKQASTHSKRSAKSGSFGARASVWSAEACFRFRERTAVRHFKSHPAEGNPKIQIPSDFPSPPQDSCPMRDDLFEIGGPNQRISHQIKPPRSTRTMHQKMRQALVSDCAKSPSHASSRAPAALSTSSRTSPRTSLIPGEPYRPSQHWCYYKGATVFYY